MCGIAGVFAYHYAAPGVDPAELDLMRRAMATRGPDGEGQWVDPQRRVGLAHRRLAVIDLNPRAAQPMLSADGEIAIVFNGEIYNYRELRADLRRAGEHPRTESDTEVLLLLYARYGEEMFSRLRGMYAFALYDGRQRRVLLARDPYGIKPLYYADDGWTVRFASQVKTLLASGRVSRAEDPAGRVGFLLFGSVPEPYTTHLEIRSVPAGSFFWIDDVGPGPARKHFSIAACFAEASRDATALSSTVPEALRDSVRHHLVADVDVGAFLSSGVDSSVLVSLAAELGPRPPRTVTLRFDEFEGRAEDEGPLAAEVARRYGAEHHVRTVGRREFEEDLPRILDAMDQPSIDGMNTWFVSKATRELGLKVALSGLGGDELFGGYPSFRDVPRWVKRMRVPAMVPGAGALFRRGTAPVVRRMTGISTKVAGMLEYGGSPEGAYFLKRGLFMPWELDGLVEAELLEEGLRRLDPLEHIAAQLDPRPDSDHGMVAALESGLYMRNQLLRDADWASMAHGVEVRTPLVDAWLARSLGPALCGGGAGTGKEVMASAAKPTLPREVVQRPKTGFTTPIKRWLQEGSSLGGWKDVPMLAREGCHWSRRLAYALHREWQA